VILQNIRVIPINFLEILNNFSSFPFAHSMQWHLHLEKGNRPEEKFLLHILPQPFRLHIRFAKQQNMLYQCSKFLKEIPSQCFDFIKKQKHCSNCFNAKHSAKNCTNTPYVEGVINIITCYYILINLLSPLNLNRRHALQGKPKM